MSEARVQSNIYLLSIMNQLIDIHATDRTVIRLWRSMYVRLPLGVLFRKCVICVLAYVDTKLTNRIFFEDENP